MIIDNVRMTYLHLEEPHAAAEGATPKFSVCMIIPKAHPQIAEIRAEIKAAVAAKWGDKPPKGLRSPLRDGDETDESGERIKGAEFTDCYFMTASSPRKVEVIVGKARRQAVTDDMTWGNYGSVKVRCFAYDTAGNRGVGCGLNGVWITKRGEPLGGNSEAWNGNVEADDMDAIAQRAAAAGQQEGDVF